MFRERKAQHLMPSDRGPLLRVVERGEIAPRRIVEAIGFVFERGVVTLVVDRDTDEILMVEGHRVPSDVVDLPDDGFWAPALGRRCLRAWDLQNLFGYWDGLQLEFGDGSGRPGTFQLMATASEMDRRRVESVE